MKKNYHFYSSLSIIRPFFLLVLLSFTLRAVAFTSGSAPVIITNPYDRTICESANTYFTIKATGVEKYLWQVSSDGVTWATATGSVYSDETTDTLKLTGAYLAAQYRCIVEGSGIKDTSTVARLNFFIIEQAVTAKATQLCEGDSTTIVVGSSQTGINYYLKRGSTVVKGPFAGTGGPLAMNTGSVLGTANYGILAQKSAVGNALLFDGINDYVIINKGYSPLTNFTFSLFIYPNEVNAGKIFSSDVLELGLNAGGIEFNVSGLGSINYNSIAKNTWSHIAITFDGTALHLYVNGTEVKTVAATGSVEASTSMSIGKDNQTACCYFNGKLDEFRVRNKCLSLAEVRESMTDCITGMETDVVAYYRFDDGTGSPFLSDLSGHGYHGELNNMNNAAAWVVGTSACGDNLACSRVMLQTPRLTVSNLIPVITSTAPAKLCDKGVAVLNATANAGKISWFASATSGAELATGPTFKTPLLTATTSYFVSSTDLGCTSMRKEIVATVNPLPDVTVTVNNPSITANQTGGIYQWLDCKKELHGIAGATGISYTPTVTGTYAVAITVNGCKDTSQCMHVTVTGIDDIENNNTLVVFPNPSNGAITVRSTSAGTYAIINEMGQTIGSIQLAAFNSYTAKIENLNNGMYIIVDLTHQQKKQKIIITN